MGRFITQKGTIVVWPGCLQGTTLAEDKTRETMIANADYLQIAMKPNDETLGPVQQSKKRRRLTDLPFEEKLKIKKLKNRAAAQNSRDKKKAYVTSLEESVISLSEMNKQLQDEAAKMLEQNKRLMAENARLESLVVKTVGDRPAVPFSPLQKELRSPTFLASKCYPLIFLCMMTLIGWLTPSKHQILWSCRSLQSHCQKQLLTLRKKRLKRWWGPRQRSWNPMPWRPQPQVILLKMILSLSLCQQMIL